MEETGGVGNVKITTLGPLSYYDALQLQRVHFWFETLHSHLQTIWQVHPRARCNIIRDSLDCCCLGGIGTRFAQRGVSGCRPDAKCWWQGSTKSDAPSFAFNNLWLLPVVAKGIALFGLWSIIHFLNKGNCSCTATWSLIWHATMMLLEKQWINVQEKTFTKWSVSSSAQIHVSNFHSGLTIRYPSEMS